MNIGGRKLYLECHGSGGPTVILQSGYGNAADIWNVAEAHPPATASGVAGFTRECAYDRPGSLRVLTDAGSPAPSPLPSRGDPAPMPRTAADVVAELHTLLATAGVPGPYVLVGHSLGGLFNNLYARTYPDRVAGLVMVDAVVPGEMRLYTAQQWAEFQQETRLASPIPGYQMEAYDLTACISQVNAAPPLRPMPAVLLLAEKEVPPPDHPERAEFVAAVQRARHQASVELAASVPGARVVTVPGTTHYIQTQRPDVVISAIRSVVP